MTVLLDTPVITHILFQGLEDLLLPVSPDVDGAPYMIKQIDGLGPPDQSVAIAKTASGGKFQGIESEEREIVVLMELHGDVKKLRNNLYTMLRTGYDPRVKISLCNGSAPQFKQWAYVTKFEDALYVEQPLVQITFELLNPTFSALSQTSYAASQLSELHPTIYNGGTAATGFQFAVKFTDDMEHWYLRVAGDQSIGMTFDKSFNAGDVLSVSTIPGQRYIHWNKKQGTVQNKMGILRDDSEWISLHPGYNHFVVPPNTGKWNWKGPLTFTPQFWGV